MKVRPACGGTADRYREGLAIHPDHSGGVVTKERLTTPPKSCAGVRNEMGVAVTGADASRVLSRGIDPNTSGCLRSQDKRGSTPDVLLDREVRSDPARSLDPVRASKHISRKTADPMVGHGDWHCGPHQES